MVPYSGLLTVAKFTTVFKDIKLLTLEITKTVEIKVFQFFLLVDEEFGSGCGSVQIITEPDPYLGRP